MSESQGAVEGFFYLSLGRGRRVSGRQGCPTGSISLFGGFLVSEWLSLKPSMHLLLLLVHIHTEIAQYRCAADRVRAAVRGIYSYDLVDIVKSLDGEQS